MSFSSLQSNSIGQTCSGPIQPLSTWFPLSHATRESLPRQGVHLPFHILGRTGLLMLKCKQMFDIHAEQKGAFHANPYKYPNTRSQGEPLYIQINDIERYLRLRRRIQEYHLLHNTPPHESLESPVSQPTEEMAAQPAPRPLKSYVIPSQDEPHNSIVAPPIEANNFKLKPSLLSTVQ